MQIFKDENFTVSAHDVAEKNFIGEELFVKITWQNQTLENFRFVIDTCFLKANDVEIDFIRETCFSKTLGAKLISPSKIHEKDGKFSFQSFASEPTKKFVESRVICDLKLCLTDFCASNVIEKIENCPAGEWSSLNFSPYGV